MCWLIHVVFFFLAFCLSLLATLTATASAAAVILNLLFVETPKLQPLVPEELEDLAPRPEQAACVMHKLGSAIDLCWNVEALLGGIAT